MNFVLSTMSTEILNLFVSVSNQGGLSFKFTKVCLLWINFLLAQRKCYSCQIIEGKKHEKLYDKCRPIEKGDGY